MSYAHVTEENINNPFATFEAHVDSFEDEKMPRGIEKSMCGYILFTQ